MRTRFGLKSLIGGGLIVTLALSAAVINCNGLPGTDFSHRGELVAGGIQVRGYIAMRTTDGKSDPRADAPLGEDINIPNLRVFLRDPSNNADSDSGTTDLSGRFTVRVKAAARYFVCWEGKGFAPGCTASVVNVSGRFKNIGTVTIPLQVSAGKVAVYGRVTLSDGASARALDPLANVNAFARVALLDASGATIQEVATNNTDQYFLPGVALNQPLSLRIMDEGYVRVLPLTLVNGALAAQRIDLVMFNGAPRIDPLVALDSSKQRVSNLLAGSTVTLNARVADRDNDPVKLLWRVSAGTLSSPTDQEPKWTVPSAPGNYAATLLAYDGRGGYATGSLNITVDRAGLVFSGTVSGTDSAALAGAQVDVNGKLAVTNSSGFFQLKVSDRKRFVLTIRKTGYAFASHIYYDTVVGGQWRLTKAEVFHVDPTQAISLQNRRSPRECAGAPSTRLDWDGNPSLATPQYQDGHGNIVPLPKDAQKLPGLPTVGAKPPMRECGPGMRVAIPANGIVDAAGHAPAGMVDIQISTVDLATGDQMPGDYTVTPAGGGAKVAQSYGAGIVEISSGATKYNLRPGTKATLTLPVDQAQIRAGGTLTPTIPLLSYDEPRGVWVEEGTLALQTAGGVPSYVTEVAHFTAYNSDQIKVGQSCLAIQNQGMPASYNLEVTVPQPDGAAPVTFVRTVVGGNSETALLNLPAHTNITMVPIRTTSPDPLQNNLPIGVFVVNTGAPQNPAWPRVPGGFVNEPSGPPYYHETAGVSDGACSTKVVLQDLGLSFYPATPLGGAFLHGIGAFAAVNLSDTDPAFPGDASALLRNAVTLASQQYRGQIDPRHLRPTLPCFKEANRMPLRPGESCPQHAAVGFTPQPALTETTAAYANTIDLGFGREMHCVRDGANVACYVSNHDSLLYTGPGQGSDVTKAQHAVEGLNGLRLPDATVAMEYSVIEDAGADGTPIVTSDPTQVVKFYVFNQAGNPVDAANLDGLGARPVPQLCMVCHGGYIPNAGPPTTGTGVPTPAFLGRDDVKLEARFIPFDLRSLSYAAPDSDVANPFNKLNQQTAFRDLNQMVKVAPPPDPFDPFGDAVSVLFDTWYPGGVPPQLESAPVPAWNTDPLHQTTYRDVVGKSCRTCHISNFDGTLRFERPGASVGVGFEGRLGAVQSRVCKDHVMPHARRTHDLFWTSVGPSQPALLQSYGDTINSFGWQKVGDPGVDPSVACGQEFTPGGGPISPVSPFTPVATILSGNCVGCHNAGNAAAGTSFAKLNLEPAVAYSQLVGVNAFELPTMKRIAAGAATENTSYLWHKIANTHSSLPGTFNPPGPGSAMPQGTTGLLSFDPASANVIRAWIQGGALP